MRASCVLWSNLFKVLCTCDARFSQQLLFSSLCALHHLSRSTVPLCQQSADNRQPSIAYPTTRLPPLADRPQVGQPSAGAESLWERTNHNARTSREKHSSSAQHRHSTTSAGLCVKCSAKLVLITLHRAGMCLNQWSRACARCNQVRRPITLQSFNRKRLSRFASLSLICTAFVVQGLP